MMERSRPAWTKQQDTISKREIVTSLSKNLSCKAERSMAENKRGVKNSAGWLDAENQDTGGMLSCRVESCERSCNERADPWGTGPSQNQLVGYGRVMMEHQPSEDLRTVVLRMLEREIGAILEQAIAKDPLRFLPSREDVDHHPPPAGDEGGTGQDSGDWVLSQRQRHCLGFECLEHRTNSAPQAASLLIEKPSNWVSSPGELKLRATGTWATKGGGGHSEETAASSRTKIPAVQTHSGPCWLQRELHPRKQPSLDRQLPGWGAGEWAEGRGGEQSIGSTLLQKGCNLTET